MAVFEFDVALTFAGEDRTYVRQVADALRTYGVSVFYDQFEQARLWGEDLGVYLDEVYRKKSRYVALFGSAHYVAKVWTSHERRSAQARAIEERGAAYLLPVLLDDSEIPGLPPTIGFLDGRIYQPAQVADLLRQKLGFPAVKKTELRQDDLAGVPLTPDDLQNVITRRPEGWEWLLFAGGIWQAVKSHEEKALDHDIGYASRTGVHVSAKGMKQFVTTKIDEISRLIEQLDRMLGAESQDWALGAPGESGDPIRISHLCTRFAATYEQLLDWAADIRGTSCPSEYSNLLFMLSRYADPAVTEIRNFAETLVREIEKLPAHFADPDSGELNITVKLTITMDDRIADEFLREFKRLIEEERG